MYGVNVWLCGFYFFGAGTWVGIGGKNPFVVYELIVFICGVISRMLYEVVIPPPKKQRES